MMDEKAKYKLSWPSFHSLWGLPVFTIVNIVSDMALYRLNAIGANPQETPLIFFLTEGAQYGALLVFLFAATDILIGAFKSRYLLASLCFFVYLGVVQGLNYYHWIAQIQAMPAERFNLAVHAMNYSMACIFGSFIIQCVAIGCLCDLLREIIFRPNKPAMNKAQGAIK